MVHHNQVNKETTWGLQAVSRLLGIPWKRMQWRTQHKWAVGREYASVIWKSQAQRATNGSHVTLTIIVVLFSTLHFPTDFRTKERVLAVYWGHRDQQCQGCRTKFSSAYALLLNYLCFGAPFLQESGLNTEVFILSFLLGCVLLPWQRGWLKQGLNFLNFRATAHALHLTGFFR